MILTSSTVGALKSNGAIQRDSNLGKHACILTEKPKNAVKIWKKLLEIGPLGSMKKKVRLPYEKPQSRVLF